MVSTHLPNRTPRRGTRLNGFVSLQIIDGGALTADRRSTSHTATHPATLPTPHPAEWRSAARAALGPAPHSRPYAAPRLISSTTPAPEHRVRHARVSLSFCLDWLPILLLGLSIAAAGIASIALALHP